MKERSGRRGARPLATLSRPGLVGGLGLAIALVVLTPPSARADCQPDPAAPGADVTCSGFDFDGFRAGPGVNRLDVLVDEMGSRMAEEAGQSAPEPR